MCKDDDRVIESLVSQINDLQEELKQYSVPEGIPEGLNEEEIDFITDIYAYYSRHKNTLYFINSYENTVRCEITVSTYEVFDYHEPVKRIQTQAVFNLAISGANYQEDSKNYYKIVEYLKELLRSE